MDDLLDVDRTLESSVQFSPGSLAPDGAFTSSGILIGARFAGKMAAVLTAGEQGGGIVRRLRSHCSPCRLPGGSEVRAAALVGPILEGVITIIITITIIIIIITIRITTIIINIIYIYIYIYIHIIMYIHIYIYIYI